MPGSAVRRPAGVGGLPEGRRSLQPPASTALCPEQRQPVCVFQSQSLVSSLETSLRDLQTEHDALKLEQQKVRGPTVHRDIRGSEP